MKRFKVEQTQKSSKSNKACVELSTCIEVGGGAI